MSWKWLDNPVTPPTWGFIGRVLVKATLFFILINALWVIVQPLATISGWTVYGWLVPYRERLPYGENPDSYNLSLNSLEAMFATHALNQPKASDEYRVVVIGDSGIWGILLNNADTLTGQLNALNLQHTDGRTMRFYNVGHPIMSVTKDLLLLDMAMRYQPDAILWAITLESLPLREQLEPPLVQNNAERVRELITRFDLPLAGDDARLVSPSLFDSTLVGQRRPLADWLRLNLYGVAWATTGIDQVIEDYTPRSNDFDPADYGGNLEAWQGLTPADDLGANLAITVIEAGHELVDVPLWVVNEPIFIADGQNSNVRYNAWYPRWAYDAYRERLQAEADAQNWRYLDLWDAIPAPQFTDSPVHLTPAGSALLAEVIATRWQAQ